MRWVGTLSSPGDGAAPLPGAGADWSAVTAGALRLWHGPSAPADGVRRVDVPGCFLIVLGCCSVPDRVLTAVASRVADGHLTALGDVDGSRVVIAALPGDGVVLAGDLAGQRPVFHTSSGGRMVVGSDSRLLAASAGSALDPGWLAVRLLTPAATDVWWTGTPWRGVAALRPGWTLHLEPGLPPLTFPDLRLRTPAARLTDAGPALRCALERAVAARTTPAGRVSTDLSGGLDSSTIAALAARGDGPPVPAVTLTASGAEDTTLAVALAAGMARLEHHTLDLPGTVLPYAALDECPPLDEPTHLPVTSAHTRWWLGQVAALGTDLHLSGEGGDNVLTAPPAYLADLAAPARVLRLWRDAAGWAQLRREAPHAVVTAAVSLRATSYQSALLRAARELRQPDASRPGWPGVVSWLGRPGAGLWATPDARELAAAALEDHAAAEAWPLVPGDGGTGDTAAWLALGAGARAHRAHSELAAWCGVQQHAPMLDDGVVRACWQVPACERSGPTALKPLLRHAVADLLPPLVLHRSTKGAFTGLHYAGLRAHAATLAELFTGSRLAGLGLVDDKAVREELHRGASGLPVRLAAIDMVVGTEVWLRTSADTAAAEGRRREGARTP